MRYVIPLTPEPQRFSIVLAGRELLLAVRWMDAPEGGWLLDMADAAYDRADSKLQQQAKDAADRKAAADKKAKEEKAAQEAADKAARSEARRQITLILRNGGTVPNDLWEQSGYSAVTIAAMLRGRKG